MAPSSTPRPVPARSGARTRPAPVRAASRALLEEAPDDVHLLPGAVEPAQDRRGAGTTALRRRRVAVLVTVLVGAVLLGWSLSREPGDPLFLVSSLVLAAVWLGGARLSGHVPLGWWRTGSGERRRPVVPGVLVGASAMAVFFLGALVVAQLPVLREAVLDVLAHAALPGLVPVVGVALLNAVAEEAFFRGALYDAVRSPGADRSWRPVLVTTVVYTVVTAATGNVMLVLAAAVLGLLCGLHRRSTGGVLGPVLIHVVWSIGMLLVLRPLIEAAG
ncbi:CPBP family intramembrane glutamic endopeptidase [Auraticoccus monumenti]|uniref:CAAX prenyl protease 2/Lysostaphin resistance protein A-like domain-containing protein n=1 Tax=Auraticoccus monumenti TaxID=675864 RepID=A0A1G7EJ65_9ACTN|nr:CPBP family intramembrane glutamic endopeptidase [Auraticoccus monumenti]SDE63730.1 hypothetical protein SAMN04489747_3965 [Auraticoccus monumenti]